MARLLLAAAAVLLMTGIGGLLVQIGRLDAERIALRASLSSLRDLRPEVVAVSGQIRSLNASVAGLRRPRP